MQVLLFCLFVSIFCELLADKRRQEWDSSPPDQYSQVLHVVLGITSSWAVWQYLVTKSSSMVSNALMSASEAVGIGRCPMKGRTVLSAVRERGW